MVLEQEWEDATGVDGSLQVGSQCIREEYKSWSNKPAVAGRGCPY